MRPQRLQARQLPNGQHGEALRLLRELHFLQGHEAARDGIARAGHHAVRALPNRVQHLKVGDVAAAGAPRGAGRGAVQGQGGKGLSREGGSRRSARCWRGRGQEGECCSRQLHGCRCRWRCHRKGCAAADPPASSAGRRRWMAGGRQGERIGRGGDGGRRRGDRGNPQRYGGACTRLRWRGAKAGVDGSGSGGGGQGIQPSAAAAVPVDAVPSNVAVPSPAAGGKRPGRHHGAMPQSRVGARVSGGGGGGSANAPAQRVREFEPKRRPMLRKNCQPAAGRRAGSATPQTRRFLHGGPPGDHPAAPKGPRAETSPSGTLKSSVSKRGDVVSCPLPETMDESLHQKFTPGTRTFALIRGQAGCGALIRADQPACVIGDCNARSKREGTLGV